MASSPRRLRRRSAALDRPGRQQCPGGDRRRDRQPRRPAPDEVAAGRVYRAADVFLAISHGMAAALARDFRLEASRTARSTMPSTSSGSPPEPWRRWNARPATLIFWRLAASNAERSRPSARSLCRKSGLPPVRTRHSRRRLAARGAAPSRRRSRHCRSRHLCRLSSPIPGDGCRTPPSSFCPRAGKASPPWWPRRWPAAPLPS